MAEFLTFLAAVLDHWVAWGTGSAIVLVMAVLDALHRWTPPRTLYVAFLALGLFISCYQAWRDQYRENIVAREVGSLAFVDLGGDFNRDGHIANPQLQINLRNIRSGLIKYQMDSMKIAMESREVPPPAPNLGGYVYGGQTTTFRANTLMGLELSHEPISGTLEYALTYWFVGSKIILERRCPSICTTPNL